MKKERGGERAREHAPLQTILVAADGTPPAAWAVERALRLPIATGGKLVVARVLPEDAPPKYAKQLASEAQHFLREIARRIQSGLRKKGRSDLSVSTVFRVGAPYRELIRAARSEGADLLVLGRHGRRPVRDLLLGSTAEKILHGGDIPVLIVNRMPAAAYRRPAVALDLDETARTTLELALRTLGGAVANLEVIHAYGAPFEGAITHRESDAYRRECRRQALTGLREIVDSVGEVPWEAALRLGDPRSVIIRAAKTHRADLIVLGTHGRSGLSHFLLGSVAEYVIRSAKCDVLVARPQRFSFALP